MQILNFLFFPTLISVRHQLCQFFLLEGIYDLNYFKVSSGGLTLFLFVHISLPPKLKSFSEPARIWKKDDPFIHRIFLVNLLDFAKIFLFNIEDLAKIIQSILITPIKERNSALSKNEFDLS
jgi:hypothetical protein